MTLVKIIKSVTVVPGSSHIIYQAYWYVTTASLMKGAALRVGCYANGNDSSRTYAQAIHSTKRKHVSMS